MFQHYLYRTYQAAPLVSLLYVIFITSWIVLVVVVRLSIDLGMFVDLSMTNDSPAAHGPTLASSSDWARPSNGCA